VNFGHALEALKAGQSVQRSGWNGKGLTLKLQVPDAHSKMTLPYIYMEYPTNVPNPGAPAGARVPWLASQTDVLADDWAVVGPGVIAVEERNQREARNAASREGAPDGDPGRLGTARS
jgi:hypothetical protein